MQTGSRKVQCTIAFQTAQTCGLGNSVVHHKLDARRANTVALAQITPPYGNERVTAGRKPTTKMPEDGDQPQLPVDSPGIHSGGGTCLPRLWMTTTGTTTAGITASTPIMIAVPFPR